MASLEREYAYFKQHQDELVRKYEGRFIVVVGEAVVADYDDDREAYLQSKAKYGAGKFLIQQCLPADQIQIRRFHSRVVVP